MRGHYFFCLLLAGVVCGEACRKSFLGASPNSAFSQPHTIDDCQALLDNDIVMNGFGDFGYPYLGLTASDDLYASDLEYDGYTLTEQQAYTWAPAIYSNEGLTDWSHPYQTITTANEAITVLDPMHPAVAQHGAWNRTEGIAHFFRAFAFFSVAQLFAPAYDSSSAATDPGLPLRMTADIGEKLYRSTVQATYDLIISDLKTAIRLLPTDSVWYPTRPSPAAAYGLLARVYLSARNYQLALLYSDSSLHLTGPLMQYDTIPNTTFPFHRWNPEVLFSAVYYSSGPSALHRSYADSLVFQSYAAGDLRRMLFFKGGNFFFGRYDDNGYGYCGIATDEMVLTRAECFAREGDVTDAMKDLNQLLSSRWSPGAYTTRTAVDANDALQQVLTERRKELLFRGTRWMDLRRLNKESRWAITLHRLTHGVVYSLPPNDPRYVFPIPADVLTLNPMPQNPR